MFAFSLRLYLASSGAANTARRPGYFPGLFGLAILLPAAKARAQQRKPVFGDCDLGYFHCVFLLL